MNNSFGALFWKKLVTFVYPNRCPFCARLIPAERTVCPGCERHLRHPGKLIFLESDHTPMLTTAAFFYETVARRGLLRFKYQQAIQLGPYFAMQTAAALQTLTKAGFVFDAMVPVPRSPEKRDKDWHLGDLTARFGKATGLPVFWKALNRLPGTTPQHRLDAAERRENAQHLFELQAGAQNLLQGKCLLLVDDVITTGSTMLACRDLLLKGGAKQVCGIAVCYRDLTKTSLQPEVDDLSQTMTEPEA